MALVGNISGSSQSNSLIALSGSAIFAKRSEGLFPSMPGSDVVFFVSGSSGTDKAAFGGDVVVTGSLSAGAVAFSSADISGNLSAGGTLGVTGVATFANDIAINGNDLTSTQTTFNLLNATVTTLNIGAGASAATNIGHASGLTTIAGDIKIAGNDIQSSTAAALTLSGANVAVLGDLAVAGELTVTGNVIKASSGTTAISLSGANVTIAGDLTVNGTTTTVNSTTLTVDDKNIELGSTASPDDAGADGGGITLKGSTDHTIIWRNSQDAWEFSEHLVPSGSLDLGLTGDRWRNMFLSGDASITGDLEVNGGDFTSTAATFNLLDSAVTTLNIGGGASTALNLGNASATNTVLGKTKFSQGLSGSLTKLADGTSYIIAGGGISIVSASNGAITITGQAGGGIGGSDTQVQFNDGGSFGGDSGLTYNKTTDALTVAGALTAGGVLAVNGASLTSTQTTFNLLNTTTTTLNIGGAATSLLVGATACAMAVGGVNSPSSTIQAATGSFGRVTTSSTSTFGGATTHNGGISATTLSASGAAQLGSTLTVTGAATLNGGIDVESGLLAVANGGTGVTMSGNASVGGTLGVTGVSTFTGQTIHNGGISASGITCTTLSASGAASLTSTLSVSGATTLHGAVTLGDEAADVILATGAFGSNLTPSSDRGFNLGSPSARWNNIYTGDLHLRNERGNWTVIEEESYLSIRNNVSGKMFKFVLEEISLPDSVE